MKPTCKKCERNFKTLTKKGICYYCYKKETGKWPLEYSNSITDKQGNLISNEGPMKFKKSKSRNRRKPRKKKTLKRK